MSTIKTSKSGITYTKRKTRSKTVKFEKTPKKSEGKRTGFERSNTLEQGSDITNSFDLSHDAISKDDWKTQSMMHEDVERSFDSINFDMAKSFELENGHTFEGHKESESENSHNEKYEENKISLENVIQESQEDENQLKEEVKENPIIPLEKENNFKIEIKEEPKLKSNKENNEAVKNASETKPKEGKSSKVIYGVAIGALVLLGIGIIYIRNKK
ncbi:unnamed protein product [Blepharisma stoltei]|uniref:Uncharacterized protein n=1 Tax=Blepharisma stoltei TaxID=1481888 RepID=A0AAU9JGJ8_9CILI|nr:unnamed protein product [Blepharisma stoltei]